MQVGVVTGGHPVCGGQGETGVYSKIGNIFGWVQDVICNELGSIGASFCHEFTPARTLEEDEMHCGEDGHMIQIILTADDNG